MRVFGAARPYHAYAWDERRENVTILDESEDVL